MTLDSFFLAAASGEGVDSQLIISVGLVLAAALAAGQLVSLIGLPRVTAYLLVGLGLGPYGWTLIPEAHFFTLEPIGELAMALVLFHIGCHFTLAHIRRIWRRVLPLSLGELGATFLLVTLGALLLQSGLGPALLLATLALATAPATTMLVLKEKQSEGPITECAIALLVLNNLAAIALFELVLVSVHVFSGGAEVSLSAEMQGLFGGLLSAIGLGAAAGVMASYACAVLERTRWLVLLIAMASLLLGVCHQLEVPHLLAFLMMGMTLANASDRSPQIEQELDRITALLCVVFFVIEGAKMDLAGLMAAGLIGVVFIVCRAAGKYLGIHLIARRKQEEPSVRNWLGLAMLSQAGVALALCGLAAEYDAALGKQLRDIIYGTVIVFEIAGPVLIRQAIMRGGEVSLAEAIRHRSTSLADELRALWNRLLLATGKNPWASRSDHEVTVSQLMRTNIVGIDAAATFDELVHYFEHSHDNTFPVVSQTGRLIGVIRYNDLRDALFDPKLGSLVCAADLAQPTSYVLLRGDGADRAREVLNASDDDALPVVDEPDSGRFVGVLRRRDLMRMLRK